MTRGIGTAGVALMLTGAVAGCGGGGAGPLAWPKNAGTSVVGIPVETGQLAVTAIPLDALAVVEHPIVLLEVRPQNADDAHGLRIRYAATTGRGMHIGGERGWEPARWDIRPLAGFVIPPHTPAAVVIGASAAKPGVYRVRGFTVTYRVGGTRYRAPQQIGLEVCAGRRSCPSG